MESSSNYTSSTSDKRNCRTTCTSNKSVDRNTFTRDFSHAPCAFDHTHIVAQGVSGAHSFHPHAIHDVTCLSVRCWSSFCLPSLYLSYLPFLFHCLPVLCHAQLPQCRHRRGLKTTALTHNEEYCPVAIYNLLTGYEPNLRSKEAAQRRIFSSLALWTKQMFEGDGNPLEPQDCTLKKLWRRSHPLCPRRPKTVTSDLWRQVWPLHRCPFGNCMVTHTGPK